MVAKLRLNKGGEVGRMLLKDSLHQLFFVWVQIDRLIDIFIIVSFAMSQIESHFKATAESSG